ncbi:MAG: FAD binding domain-containing protein [Actinomycetota bacterium]
MYPSPFDYVAVTSWEAAIEVLEREGEDAKILAGGQSLVPMMAMRLARPSVLVDVNRIPGSGPGLEDGVLVLPALTRHAEICGSEMIQRIAPVLTEAARYIGNVRVRHRGTIGGSLAHADPSGELPCVAVALEATVVAQGPSGERRIPAAELFESFYSTTLRPDEVITSVRLAVPPEGAGSAFAELIQRAGDFAVAEAAAVVELEPGGRRCQTVRLALGAVGERPQDLSEVAGSVLIGEEITTESVAAVASRVSSQVDPGPSVHSGASYRKRMAGVVAGRAVLAAASRHGRESRG